MSKQIPWKSGLAQAFFVVLGVGLALVGNEWRENSALKKDAEIAYLGIQDEIVSNRQLALESFEYNFNLFQKLQAFANNPENAGNYPDLSYFTQGYVKPASFIYTAWEVAKETNAIGHIDYESVLTFSNLYNDQKNYDVQSLKVGDLIYAQLLDKGRDGMAENYQNMSDIITTFWFRECELLGKFDTVLEKIQTDYVTQAEIPTACKSILSRTATMD